MGIFTYFTLNRYHFFIRIGVFYPIYLKKKIVKCIQEQNYFFFYPLLHNEFIVLAIKYTTYYIILELRKRFTSIKTSMKT